MCSNILETKTGQGFDLLPITAALAAWCVWPIPPALAQTNSVTSPTALEPIIVTGKFHGFHDVDSEADRVGPADQPEWTTRRAFAETDIYVIPPGEIEFNQFYISSHSRHGKPENLFESEFEFGLPWRTQFDVEVNSSVNDGRPQHDGILVELPHALADWGKIPLNPTIDGGWEFKTDETDSYFFSLLLADEFSKRVHFGADLRFDNQIGGEREKGYELNLALSYVAKDLKLAVGAEFLVEYETAREQEEGETVNTYSTTVLAGPTLLFKPTRNTHLGLVPLFGLTHDSPVVEAFFIFGIDLEPFASRRPVGEEDLVHPVRRYR